MAVRSPVPTALNREWKILIIDDDEDDFLIARDMLKEAKGRKFNVHWADTYAGGREELISNHYNAVLVDYDLGIHSGIELIREANERGYAAPLILFTGRGNYEVDVEAMQAGATLYLTKGEANPLLLERAIRYAIELKQKEQALRDNEAALRTSEERFHQAFNASPNAQVISRMEDGRIETINDSFERLFGYRREEVLRKSSLELNLFANPADREEAVRRLRADQFIRDFEIDIQTKSGEIRHASLSVEIITIGNEPLMLTVIQDITARKRAEAALRLSEERFYKAFNATPDALVISRLADGQIQGVNHHFVQLFGYSQLEVIGKTSLDLDLIGHPMDRNRMVQQLRAAGFLRDFETTIRTKTGEIRQASLSIESLTIENESHILTIIEDITGRKQAEEALHESIERYRNLFESIDEGFCIIQVLFDENEKPVDYRFLEVNPAFERQTGIEHAIGRRMREIAPQHEAHWFEIYGNIALTGEALRFENRAEQLHRYYEVYAFRVGEPTERKVAVLFNDITERKQAEATLHQEREFLRKVIDATPSMVFVKDWEGRFVLVNQALARCYGTTVEGIVDKTDADFNPNADEVAHFLHNDREVIRTQKEKVIPEEPVTHADGQVRWFSTVKVPLVNPDGSCNRLLGVATDITERRQMEEELAQANATLKDYAENLQHSNQELEQFAFVASHDLQEPLRKIKLFGNIIQQKLQGKLDGETQDNFQRMMSASERMQAMINGLLDLSRVNTQGKDFVPLNLTQVVEEVVSDLETRIQAADGQVIIEDLPTIEGDEVQMHELLQNLIGNALKFHKPGVPPIVRVSGTIQRAPNSRTAEIRVEDNGIGFDQQYAERIFQPFQRLHGKTEYEGNGLGLSICQKIVERHHGTIEVQSVPGEGTTFTVSIPLRTTR